MVKTNPSVGAQLRSSLGPGCWPSASSCWITMSRRELTVSEGRSGVNQSGPPSPPALRNNVESLNSLTKLSAITLRENPDPHFFPQARERCTTNATRNLHLSAE